MEDAYRKAALRLAGVADADRRWLLEKLPAAERQVLLDALQDMGTAETNGAASARGAANGHDREADWRRILSALDPVHARQFLVEEPDWVVAVVLSAWTWSWAESFLDSLEPYRRDLIIKKLEHAKSLLKPRAREALLHAVAGEAESRAGTASREGTSGFDRMLAKHARRAERKARFWRLPWTR